MQLVSVSDRVLCLFVGVSILLSGAAMKWGVSRGAGDKMVNDTVTLHSSSPAPRDKASVTNEVSRSSQGIVRFFEITAYSPTIAECDATPLVTASGAKVRVGGIAADVRVLPFGSLVIIPGYNNDAPCEVIDTGGAIKGEKLDVFFWLADDAVQWGRKKNVPVTILRLGYGH